VAVGVRDRFLAAHELPDVDDPYELAHTRSNARRKAAVDHRELLTVIEHHGLADPDIAQIWRELRERPFSERPLGNPPPRRRLRVEGPAADYRTRPPVGRPPRQCRHRASGPIETQAARRLADHLNRTE
jgi:hypothetical protein